MKKNLMLITILVVGALIAPAAKADHAESDWCSHYCGVFDFVLDDLAAIFGSDAGDRAPSDKYVTDKPSDRSGRDIGQSDGKALGDGRDSKPKGEVDYRPDSLVPEDGAR